MKSGTARVIREVEEVCCSFSLVIEWEGTEEDPGVLLSVSSVFVKRSNGFSAVCTQNRKKHSETVVTAPHEE